MSYTESQIQGVRDISIAHMLSVNIYKEKVMITCPMPNHNDKTPSFLLDDENGYYCFGCNVAGQGYIDFATDFLIAEGEVKDRKEAFIQIMEEYG